MLRDKTIFITGASRGIGHAIAMRAARDGANIVIAAKTTEPHPKLPGTIFTAAAARMSAGMPTADTSVAAPEPITRFQIGTTPLREALSEVRDDAE